MTDHSNLENKLKINKSRVFRPFKKIREFEPTGQETFFDMSRELPFEAPAKEFIPGPFYKDVSEVMPEMAFDDSSPAVNLSTEKPNGLDVDRRDFMRLFSTSALLGAAACVRRPEEIALPYVNQPIDQVVGVPVFYASTCGECAAGCGVLVRTREGRPTKIEGNPRHPISQGASCALGQSTLQALYHPERPRKSKIKRGDRIDHAECEEVYQILGSRLKSAKNVAIVTGPSTGHRHTFFKEFLMKIGSKAENLFAIESNPLYEATSAAYKKLYGVDGIPRYEFGAADLIVGIGSDFLDIGLSRVFGAKTFARSHAYKNGKKGEFVQFESTLTNTGAKADKRIPIAPGDEIFVALRLLKSLLEHKDSQGGPEDRRAISSFLGRYANAIAGVESIVGFTSEEFDKLADELVKRKSLIVSGATAADRNSTTLQMASAMANLLSGGMGQTVFFDEGWMKSPVPVGDTKRFADEVSSFDLVFVIDCNPALVYPKSSGVIEKLSATAQLISIQPSRTEFDDLADMSLNGAHYLESWGDEQTVAGFWSLRQPAIRPFTGSRQAEDILMWVAASSGNPMGHADYQSYLKAQWTKVQAVMGTQASFDVFWKAVLRAGFVGKLEKRALSAMKTVDSELTEVAQGPAGPRLVVPLDHRVLDGRGADRPILQEMGDPMTTITWDSWVSVHPEVAKQNGWRRNDVLKLETSVGSLEVALYPLPGMHKQAVYLNRGAGRPKGLSRISDGVGVNALDLVGAEYNVSGSLVTSGLPVTLTKTGKVHRLAALQKHNDIANRSDIMKKITLADAKENLRTFKDVDTVPDLYPKVPEDKDYNWGMSVDLSACSGCGACIVACTVENNVPQVGREQILMGREMHWIRLDRYFAGSVDTPEVSYQPVMCQHCKHAPCEGVCPVFATLHSPEGMNSQVYNRCVGTRYCANACPYKVRRFNWFTHKWNVMGDRPMDRNPFPVNPDITVRTRGVMEKCTFCVHRVRDAKHWAKANGGTVKDGEVRTACQEVCPSNAIVFGNLKDPKSRVADARRDYRSFLMLGGDPTHKHYGLKTLPNVNYLAEVTLQESVINKGKGHHGPAKDAAVEEQHG